MSLLTKDLYVCSTQCRISTSTHWPWEFDVPQLKKTHAKTRKHSKFSKQFHQSWQCTRCKNSHYLQTHRCTVKPYNTMEVFVGTQKKWHTARKAFVLWSFFFPLQQTCFLSNSAFSLLWYTVMLENISSPIIAPYCQAANLHLSRESRQSFHRAHTSSTVI